MLCIHHVFCCLLTAGAALAPPVVPPQVVPPVQPQALRSSGVVPKLGAQDATIMKSFPAVRETHVTHQLSWKYAESKLEEILRTTSETVAAMHYESEVLGLTHVANGELSVSALLDVLERAQPPPAVFDRDALIGQWRLQYTSIPPTALIEQATQHSQRPVIDLSVVASISQSGIMDTTSLVLFHGGETKVTRKHGRIIQKERSRHFLMGNDVDEAEAVEVTYLNNGLLVLRVMSAGIDTSRSTQQSTQTSQIVKTLVWRKVSGTPTATQFFSGPAQLWRFGLLDGALRKAQSDVGVWRARTPPLFIHWELPVAALLLAAIGSRLLCRTWRDEAAKDMGVDTVLPDDVANSFPDCGQPKFALATLAGAQRISGLRPPSGRPSRLARRPWRGDGGGAKPEETMEGTVIPAALFAIVAGITLGVPFFVGLEEAGLPYKIYLFFLLIGSIALNAWAIGSGKSLPTVIDEMIAERDKNKR